MKNIWIVCRKELRSYFVSPIGYILLVTFAVIAGFFFWTIVNGVLQVTMEAQLEGEPYPMNINEQIVRPLLLNLSVIQLLLIPLITMRLFAEEKRTGTIELLVTSPITDTEVILGKWLAAVLMYSCMLLTVVLDMPGHAAAGRRAARDRDFYFFVDEKSDHRRRGDFRRLPAAVRHGLGQRLRWRHLGAGAFLLVAEFSL
jgi:ABC-2 family transporter protein